MRRVVGLLVGLVVVALLACIPALFYGIDLDGSDQAYEETSITRYVADFDIDDEGRMQVTETLTVNFPYSGKHGIFRFWDVADANAEDLRRVPQDIEVTRDGRPEPWERLEESRGRYVVAKIGSASTFISPGEHVYEISYVVDDVLIDGTEGHDTRFYWNLIPGGWAQDIQQARLTVHLPAAAEDVECAVGAGETTGCEAKGEGTETLVVRTEGLARNTPVTVSVGQDLPTPEPQGETRLWPVRFDPVLGPGTLTLLVVLGLAAGAAAWGSRLGARSREEQPPYPLMYAPPDGVGPAQGHYLLTEDVGREQFVASIMQAAEQGAVDLGRDGDAWSLTDKNGPQGWAGVDPVTSQVARLLSGPGTTFVADKSSVSAGKLLKSRMSSFESETKSWAQRSGLVVASGLGGFGGLMVLAAFAATGAALIWNPFDMTLTALVPAAFALGASSLLRTGSGTKRTAAGRDLWSRIGGFHRVLSTPSSEERFDFSGRKELYTQYVPWAVAFGCADAWAEKYRTEMGEEPPVPTYFGTGHGAWHGTDPTSDMVGDFSDTLDSAISSYEATQRSSSSGGGGGGFSGGGGGGGGGGGSW